MVFCEMVDLALTKSSIYKSVLIKEWYCEIIEMFYEKCYFKR